MNSDVEDYLMQELERRKRLDDPDYRALGRAPANAMASQNNLNNLYASLAESAAQIGSTGGKIADASPVRKFADASASNNAQYMKGLQTEDAENARNQSSSDKISEYLLGKQNQKEIAQDNREQRSEDRQAALDNTKMIVGQKIASNEKISQEKAKDREFQASQRSQDKTDAKTDDQFVKFGHDISSGLASSRSDLGKQQDKVSSADRVLALGEQGGLQEGGLDKRQIHELAIASANLVSGGSGAAQSTIESLVPHSVGTSAAGIEEWLTSEPQGTGQQAFVARMLETAEREKHIAQQKINGYKAEVVQQYGHLKKKDPDRFQNLVSLHLGDDAQFADNGKYVAKPFTSKTEPKTSKAEGGTAIAAPAPDAHPQANAAIEWAKKNPDDPRAKEIMKRLGGG